MRKKRGVKEASETASNNWMRKHGVFHKTGIYPEDVLLRRTREKEVPYDEDGEDAEYLAFLDIEIGTLEISELIALGRSAGLTSGQAAVWELWVMGMNEREIADALGLTNHQIVNRRLKRAREKVRTSFSMCKYYGLWEVYDELVNRVCKAKPYRSHSATASYPPRGWRNPKTTIL